MALTYITQAANTTTSAQYTYSGLSFGAASSDRRIIVSAVGRKGGTGLDVTSVTVAGITATLLVKSIEESDNNSQFSVLYMASVPSGTSGDVVIDLNTSALRSSVAVYSLTGFEQPQVFDTSTTGSTTQETATLVDVKENSYVISGVMNGASASNPRWNTGQTTQDFGIQFQTNGYHSGASAFFTSAATDIASIFRTDNNAISNVATAVIYDASSPLKRYNGSEWIEVVKLKYNGSSWV